MMDMGWLNSLLGSGAAAGGGAGGAKGLGGLLGGAKGLGGLLGGGGDAGSTKGLGGLLGGLAGIGGNAQEPQAFQKPTLMQALNSPMFTTGMQMLSQSPQPFMGNGFSQGFGQRAQNLGGGQAFGNTLIQPVPINDPRQWLFNYMVENQMQSPHTMGGGR